MFAGNATVAMSLSTLNELRISHILTIDSCPLPNSIRNNPQIINKYIKVNDVPKGKTVSYSKCKFTKFCISYMSNRGYPAIF